MRRDFPDEGGTARPYQGADGITFQNEAETARPRKHSSRPPWIRRDPSYQGGDGLTFQTKTESAHFFKPKRKCRDFPDRDKYGASKKVSLRPRWMRRDFPDQDRVGAFFQTKREKPQFSRPRQIRRDQESILAPAVDTFHTRVETASLSRTRRRRRDQENIPRDRRGYGAILHTRVETA